MFTNAKFRFVLNDLWLHILWELRIFNFLTFLMKLKIVFSNLNKMVFLCVWLPIYKALENKVKNTKY